MLDVKDFVFNLLNKNSRYKTWSPEPSMDAVSKKKKNTQGWKVGKYHLQILILYHPCYPQNPAEWREAVRSASVRFLLKDSATYLLLLLLLLRYPVILHSSPATGDGSEGASSLVNRFCAGSVSLPPSVSPLSALPER